MRSYDSPTTSTNLIQLARTNDSDAWRRLADIYSPLVYSWVRRAGLQDSDAADVVQNVFQIVFKSLGRFRRDRAGDTFRGWLWTITRNEIRGWFRKHKTDRGKAVGGSDANNRLTEIPDWVQNESETEEIEPHEDAETMMIKRAAEAIKDDFEPHTWQAFWQSTVEGKPSSEIAEELQMTSNAIRQAKFRVLARLREYIA